MHKSIKNNYYHKIKNTGGIIMASCLIQLRVDENLKKEATEVFDKLGLDLSSAIRIFLTRAIQEEGIPFSMVLRSSKAEEMEEVASTEEE